MTAAIWSELDVQPAEAFTARKPWISSFRRNLQREHFERLTDLTLPGAGSTAAYKPISNLALGKLRDLQERIQKVVADRKPFMDPYTLAHLTEVGIRIGKVLDAQYIYNVDGLGGGSGAMMLFLKELKETLGERPAK